MKRVITIILCVLLLSGCGKKYLEDNSSKYISLIQNNVEVFSDVNLYDIIDIDNSVEVITKNIKINTDKVGKINYDINYKKDKKNYIHKITINVVDTEAPIVFSGTSKTVNINYSEDICNIITYGDNYDGNIKCEIDGDYDLTKEGTYKLVYNLSDSSNNTKKVNVVLRVVKPSTGGGSGGTSNPKKTNFEDIVKLHKTNDTEIGIDVSKWQGEIDFNKVKNAGATFVMMRIGVQGSKTKEISVDNYYVDNIKKAREAGLKVGVYFYSVATSTKEAKEHAKWVIDNLNKEKLDLPIAFDWENWSNWNSYKISFHEINEVANTFMDVVKDNGYEGMLYSSKFYLETIWKNKKEYPVWLAHYTSNAKKSSYEGKYNLWQVCNNGKIDGINGDVDIDVLYK